tara:strand:- start:895 stop:1143 length:249 start_codon:yes stop_codon:yes gene_type:complete
MDNEAKWGNTYDAGNDMLGKHTMLKIACIQFIVVVCILFLTQPFIVMTVKDDTKKYMCVFKTLLLSSMIVLGTYFIPPLIRN